MGKKTDALVKDFRINYETCDRFLNEFETFNKSYVRKLANLKAVSKKIPDNSAIPKPVQDAFNEIYDFSRKRIPALVTQADDTLKKTSKSLIDLNKWVDTKVKQDATTWRKIKDTLKGKG